MLDEGKFLGRGIAFPFRVNPDGRIAQSAGSENIRENIRIILLTEPQERLMLPQFGGGLKRFLFRPNTTATQRLIQEAIVQSLGRWEPRIRVENVTVDPDPDEAQAVQIFIRYRLVATAAEDRLALRVLLSG
jgi:phage baseplate assembly protein W